jgi:ABC-type spermidine/putrescine transport system permease subunit I
MRVTSFVLAASLVLAPGCAQFVVPPILGGAAGAGIGAAISDSEDRAGAMVTCGVFGVLLGVVADVLLLGYLLDRSVNQDESGARR